MAGNMWKFIVFSAIFFTVVYGRPQQSFNDPGTTPIAIVTQYSNNAPDGSFNNTYETANGIRVENAGYLKRITVPQHEENGRVVEQHEEDIIVQVGSYSYTDTEGNLIRLSYIADENGFQPTGDHLPRGPAVGPDQGESFGRSAQPSQRQPSQRPSPQRPQQQQQPRQFSTQDQQQFGQQPQQQQFGQQPQQFQQQQPSQQQPSQQQPLSQNQFSQQNPTRF